MEYGSRGVDQQSMGSPISRTVRRIRVKMRPPFFSNEVRSKVQPCQLPSRFSPPVPLKFPKPTRTFHPSWVTAWSCNCSPR